MQRGAGCRPGVDGGLPTPTPYPRARPSPGLFPPPPVPLHLHKLHCFQRHFPKPVGVAAKDDVPQVVHLSGQWGWGLKGGEMGGGPRRSCAAARGLLRGACASVGRRRRRRKGHAQLQPTPGKACNRRGRSQAGRRRTWRARVMTYASSGSSMNLQRAGSTTPTASVGIPLTFRGLAALPALLSPVSACTSLPPSPAPQPRAARRPRTHAKPPRWPGAHLQGGRPEAWNPRVPMNCAYAPPKVWGGKSQQGATTSSCSHAGQERGRHAGRWGWGGPAALPTGHRWLAGWLAG